VDHPDGKPLNNLLRMAVLAGVEIAVRLHVRRGDDLNARDGNGMTPLMLAASKNKGMICSLLLSSGADPTLTDPGGRDALALARAAGAAGAVSVLEPLVCMQVDEAPAKNETAPEVVSGANSDADVQSGGALPTITLELDPECGSFDLSGWEVEEDGSAPEDDGALSESARVVHGAISAHVPIDTSEDWGDFDAFLPERAVPLQKVGDAEGREGILRVLRRALREGSVPDREIARLSENYDGTPNEAGEALLRLVLGDMGAETDERIERAGPEGGWEASEADEDDVSEALAFLEETSSVHNEPMRLYARDVRAGKLLTAEEEIALARDMEESMSSALDVLASWPDGLAAFLLASERVRAGEIGVESITGGRATEGEDQILEAISPPVDDIEDEDEACAPLSVATREFLDRAAAVKALADLIDRGDKVALRSCLAAAQLSPSFLAGLADNSIKGASTEAEHFRLAIKRYSAARKRMIVSNLRLVISVVKRYQGFGLPFEDLVQEGNVGLMKAVDRYDWRKGFRFSTYATWWIRQQAARAVADMGKTIRTPVHVHDTMLRIKREVDELGRDTGRAPTMDVLAQRLSIIPGKLSALMARMEEPVPLHLPDSSGVAPGDCLVVDSVSSNPSVLAERAALISILEKMLGDLPPRMAKVLTLRFGLEDGDPLTLEEIGIRLSETGKGVTRERIRQIEGKALKNLAHPIRADILREFIGIPKEKPRISNGANSDEESSLPSSKNGQDEINCNRTEEVIARLQVCGAEVIDGRASGGQIVVRNLWNTPQTRTLIHRLLDVGFKPYPGMEFRK
jgi:RNA polymerase primary sigma factor